MDMIDVPQHGTVIWTDRDFDAHDYALLCTYAHAARLQNWLSGILNWHRGCHRYDAPGTLHGLGTAAARLASSAFLMASTPVRSSQKILKI